MSTEAEQTTKMYAVMKMCKDITYTDPLTRREVTQKLQGCAGFIPCFTTIEEAEAEACEGQFDILTFTVPQTHHEEQTQS